MAITFQVSDEEDVLRAISPSKISRFVHVSPEGDHVLKDMVPGGDVFIDEFPVGTDVVDDDSDDRDVSVSVANFVSLSLVLVNSQCSCAATCDRKCNTGVEILTFQYWEDVEKVKGDGTTKTYRRRILLKSIIPKNKVETVSEGDVKVEEAEIVESTRDDDIYDPEVSITFYP